MLFRVMKALSSSGVPIPPLIDLCEDSDVLGTPFYIMEFVLGNLYKVCTALVALILKERHHFV